MLKPIEDRIGRNAILVAFMEDGEEESFLQHLNDLGCRVCKGKAGSMSLQKIVAAIETAAKRENVIQEGVYREMHALYHAIMEAMHGITRGEAQLGEVLRTVGLRFAVVRGRPYDNKDEGEWIAVALYGTIGAPIKGLEHEAIGLGINHI